MEKISFKPTGVCAKVIHITLDGDKIESCPDQFAKALKEKFGE